MNATDIYELLDKNEDEHIEFKEAKSSFDSSKLAEYAVALANEHGGMLILGVTDKKPHKIVGTMAYLDGMAKVKEQLIAKVQMRIDFRQGFFSFYDKLWETIDLRNTNQHYQDGLFIWDIKTFNEAAIREAILNAVSHRDYRDAGSVFVRQYPERIEIVSPGGLPPGITFENILWEQAPRNRRLAEVFERCGLVERAGQGMNRIFESCIRESKQAPDFAHSDDYHFWITLHGDIQHPEFLRVLERIGRERVLSFSLDDFIVLQAVFEERQIEPRFEGSLHMLLDEGIIEKRIGQRRKGYVLSRRLYAAIGKSGVHTRKAGLDKDTNKELLLKHIRESEPEGAKMEEFLQVLPSFNRRMIQTFLYALRKEGKIYCSGAKKGARWHIESGGKI